MKQKNIEDIINNNPEHIVNQNYVILKSAMIGKKGIVFAENKKAPQPFATWKCNTEIDKNGQKEFNFYWGHYFCDKNAALKDFKNRISNEIEIQENEKPSVLQSLHSAKTNSISQPSKTKNHTMERE